MRIKYDQKLFDKFAQKLEGIIQSIENHCDCLNDDTSVLVLMNKIYFNAENFFIDNQIQNKKNTEILTEIRKQSDLFVSILKKYHKKYEAGEKKVLYEIKDFLKKWLKNPYIESQIYDV
jgi:hypothetical protein